MRCDLSDFFYRFASFCCTSQILCGVVFFFFFFFWKENRLLRNVQVKYMLSNLHSCYLNLRKLYTLNDFFKIPRVS